MVVYGAALRVFRQEEVLQEGIAERTLARLFKTHDGDGELALLQLVEHLVIALYQSLKLLAILRSEYEIILVLCQNIPKCRLRLLKFTNKVILALFPTDS